jgi:hypothetical protein
VDPPETTSGGQHALDPLISCLRGIAPWGQELSEELVKVIFPLIERAILTGRGPRCLMLWLAARTTICSDSTASLTKALVEELLEVCLLPGSQVTPREHQ